MKVRPIAVLLPIGIFAAMNLFAQKRAAGTLAYYIGSLALSFSGITPILRVNLVVQNPSNQRFTIRSLVAALSANGEVVGNVSSFATINVNPNSQTVLPVYVRLSALAIVTDIVTMFQNASGIQMKIDLKGTVNVNNMAVPLNVSYKIL